MISRRRFLTTTATAASMLVMGQHLLATGGKDRLKNFGFITGIIGNELKGDRKAVLKQAADFGFTEMETGRFLGDSAPSFLAYCKEIGIKPVAGGIGFTNNPEEINKKLDDLEALKVKYAVTYWPWKGGAPFKLDNCKESVEILNVMGEICQKRGMPLCWHNHDKEFTPMEEGLPFDYLMNHTDENLVKCELDIYWVAKGGADPLAVLKKYNGRIPILHVKDMAAGDAQDFACPGSGIIDFASIFREATNQGIEHYMVERDNVVNGLDCLKTSGAYLSSLRF
jgi:sugar phosphate isomerase/epimerase